MHLLTLASVQRAGSLHCKGELFLLYEALVGFLHLRHCARKRKVRALLATPHRWLLRKIGLKILHVLHRSVDFIVLFLMHFFHLNRY